MVGANDYHPVAAGIGSGRCYTRQDPAAALARVAAERIFRDQTLHKRHDAFIDGRIDHLTAPGLFAVKQRHHGPKRCKSAGHRIAETDTSTRWRPIGLANQMPETALRFADASIAGLVTFRTCLAIARYPCDHEARIDLVQNLWAKSPFFQRSRPEVFDQHIGCTDQAFEDFLPFVET